MAERPQIERHSVRVRSLLLQAHPQLADVELAIAPGQSSKTANVE